MIDRIQTILPHQKLKVIPLKRNKTRLPLSQHLYSIRVLNIVLEVLARAIRQQREMKGKQIGKEEVKLSLFASDMIAYISDMRKSTRELLQWINTFSNVAK